MSGALRQAVSRLLPRVPASAVKGAAEALPAHTRTMSGKLPGYHYDFEHGPHMLNFWELPNRQMKVAAFITIFVASGVGVPVFAVWWQQNKLKAG